MKTHKITNGLTAQWSTCNQAWFIMFMGQQVLAIKESLQEVDSWLIDHKMGSKCIDSERAKIFSN